MSRKLRPSTPGHKQKGYYGNQPIKEAEGHGGVVTVRKGMQRAIKTPCVECPFRRDSAPGYLGGYTPEMYMEATFSPASLACHRSPGFHEGEIEKQRVCTGLAAFRANTGFIASVPHPQGGLVSSAAHESTQFVGSDAETYFASPEEFIAHHKPGQKR
jgi:hypothetical protein